LAFAPHPLQMKRTANCQIVHRDDRQGTKLELATNRQTGMLLWGFISVGSLLLIVYAHAG